VKFYQSTAAEAFIKHGTRFAWDQFKAYVLSGYGGSHCLEVHASWMVSAAAKDVLVEQLTAWFKGFHGVRVESM
jgi:hypothetical protein